MHETLEQLEQHHVKYIEIHGEDKIILLTHKEHRQLHARLRREGKCNIPSEKLAEISEVARRRSPEGKAYERSEQRKMNTKKYRQSNLGQQTMHKHEMRRSSINFSIHLEKGVVLRERVRYNSLTGNIGYASWFQLKGLPKYLKEK